eukprot:m.1367005 g.1367005  ORF g.1367005 m.1367005 type:complete len:121 (+) comp24952_c0_seq57:1974-2336(+)
MRLQIAHLHPKETWYSTNAEWVKVDGTPGENDSIPVTGAKQEARKEYRHAAAEYFKKKQWMGYVTTHSSIQRIHRRGSAAADTQCHRQCNEWSVFLNHLQHSFVRITRRACIAQLRVEKH